MVQKSYTFLGIFAVLLLSLGVVNATSFTVLNISNVNAPTSIAEDAGSFNFTFNVTYTGSVDDRTVIFTDSSSNIGSVTIPSIVLNGTAGESKIITGTIDGFSNLGGNDLQVVINATAGGARDDESNFTTTITDVVTSSDTFCNAEVGNLTIYSFNIDNLGEGKDDNWKLLDEIDLEVKVRNVGGEDIRDVMVDVKITDSNDNDITGDFDFNKESISIGRIKNSKKETTTFHIPKLPADLETGTYKIYIKAYEDGNEDENCVSTTSNNDLNTDNKYYEFDVESQYDEPAIIPREGDVSTTIVTQQGDIREISFNIYNLGDQDEDEVLVTVENADFGIKQTETFRNVDRGEKKQIIFNFQIPENASAGTHKLKIYTYFDYNDGDKEDEFSYDANSYDDLNEQFLINLEVLAPSHVQPSITAALNSDAKVGEELVIISSVTNNGGDNNFVVSVDGFEDWADLVSVEPQSLSIDEGGTEEVIIKLIPSKEGFQTTTINVIEIGRAHV